VSDLYYCVKKNIIVVPVDKIIQYLYGLQPVSTFDGNSDNNSAGEILARMEDDTTQKR